jgi:hypothetical protein
MATNFNTPFSGRVEYFLQEIISSPAGALPKGAQWVLSFEGIYDQPGNTLLPVKAIKKGVMLEPQRWNIDESIDIMLDERFQLRKSCMLIQAIQIPGESTTVNVEGTQINGFLRSYIGAGRDAYNALQMSFLDTNISFVDNTIRAWVIATSHLGMLARKGDDNYRCNFSVYKLGVTSRDEPPTVLQKYTFYGACPVSVGSEEWNYSMATSFMPRDVTFIYHYYTLDSVTDNKILAKDKEHRTLKKDQQIIDSVFKGNSPVDNFNKSTTETLTKRYGIQPPKTQGEILKAKIDAQKINNNAKQSPEFSEAYLKREFITPRLPATPLGSSPLLSPPQPQRPTSPPQRTNQSTQNNAPRLNEEYLRRVGMSQANQSPFTAPPTR